jgi:hypothetical protein
MIPSICQTAMLKTFFYFAKFFPYIVKFMECSDMIISTTCYNTMIRNVNGSELSITLTKDRQKYQEQKRR